MATLAVTALCCGCSTRQTVGVMSGQVGSWAASGLHLQGRSALLRGSWRGLDGSPFVGRTKEGMPIPRRMMLFSNAWK